MGDAFYDPMRQVAAPGQLRGFKFIAEIPDEWDSEKTLKDLISNRLSIDGLWPTNDAAAPEEDG